MGRSPVYWALLDCFNPYRNSVLNRGRTSRVLTGASFNFEDSLTSLKEMLVLLEFIRLRQCPLFKDWMLRVHFILLSDPLQIRVMILRKAGVVGLVMLWMEELHFRFSP